MPLCIIRCYGDNILLMYTTEKYVSFDQPHLEVCGRPGGSGDDTESAATSLILHDKLTHMDPTHQTMANIQDLGHCQ